MSPRERGSDFETRGADWLSWTDARSRILASTGALPSEAVSLADSLGRALAESVEATATLPPWDNSAMDGYAVRGRDVRGATSDAPVALHVVGEVHAGDRLEAPLEPGQAARIMTGAPVPDGADSVVRVEHTDAEEDTGTVRIHRDSDIGRNIRPGGQDLRAGETVLEAGHTVSPGVVGVLAALGKSTVLVHRRPTVGIVPTGDELRGPDEYGEVEEGRGIPESNGPMTRAAVEAAGGRPVLLDPVQDRPDALRAALERAAQEDVVVTLGGASMGEADLVKRVLDDLGFEQAFWRVRMRPGSPFGLGYISMGGRRVPVFGLPGNPASAFVTFELFVRPALLGLAGHRGVLRRTVVAHAGEELVGRGRKAYFLRVVLRGADPPVATPAGSQGSGLVRGLAYAEGLALIPEAEERIHTGSEVEVILLGGNPAAPGTTTASPGG